MKKSATLLEEGTAFQELRGLSKEVEEMRAEMNRLKFLLGEALRACQLPAAAALENGNIAEASNIAEV